MYHPSRNFNFNFWPNTLINYLPHHFIGSLTFKFNIVPKRKIKGQDNVHPNVTKVAPSLWTNVYAFVFPCKILKTKKNGQRSRGKADI